MSGEIIIGYENLFESASVITPTSEVAGFEVENVFDGFTHSWWKPNSSTSPSITIDMGSAVDVNYYAIAAYDLTNAAVTFELRSSNDNFSVSNDLRSRYRPVQSETGVIMIKLPAVVNERYWRITFSSISNIQPIVGVLAFGMCLTTPDAAQVGFTPPTMSFDDKVLNNTSQGGAFIGRSIQRSGAKGSVRLDLMTPAWVRGEWMPFLEHARTKPFFLSWSDRHFHNLLRYSEDFSNTSIWDDTANRWSLTGAMTDDPFGGNNAQVIQIDVTNAAVRQTRILPAGNTGDVFSVRFWGKLISGTITWSAVDIQEGAGQTFTLTASWQEFQLQCVSGGNDLGHFDMHFNKSSGTPTIALFGVQCVRGSQQLPYQKTTSHVEEAAYCWTDKAINPPRYSHPNYMQAQLDFNGLTE